MQPPHRNAKGLEYSDPQVFEVELIKSAYERLYAELPQWQKKGAMVTDDASVIELFTEHKVKLVEGSYRNIKITTPEDLLTAEAFLGSQIPKAEIMS